jgi:hypothetical protein
MGRMRVALVLRGTVGALLLFCHSSCGSERSSRLSQQCCAAYQHTDSLPDQPQRGVIRLAIGGDSRNDTSHVLPWAFRESRKRDAKAFLFLGDLEITRLEDKLIAKQLVGLGGVPFYPVVGNHEVEFLGALRLSNGRHAGEEFKEDFLRVPGVKLAPLPEVVYSVDLADGIHFIALDNVSRKGEGFGNKQLDWLEGDLKAAKVAGKRILVGMHKPLAKNPITTHSMDEDGMGAMEDSRRALALFKNYGVAMVFVSHSHMYASYNQEGIEMRLTGGLGAPLVKGLSEVDGGFHHFLLLDVPPTADKTLRVEVVKFQGIPARDQKDESEEGEK